MPIFVLEPLLNLILKPVPAAGCQEVNKVPEPLTELISVKTTKPSNPLGVMSLRYSLSK